MNNVELFYYLRRFESDEPYYNQINSWKQQLKYQNEIIAFNIEKATILEALRQGLRIERLDMSYPYEIKYRIWK